MCYEIGVCIQTGWIVWKNGPFPCGSWSDLKIAREWLVHELLDDDKCVADLGYLDGGEFLSLHLEKTLPLSLSGKKPEQGMKPSMDGSKIGQFFVTHTIMICATMVGFSRPLKTLSNLELNLKPQFSILMWIKHLSRTN